MKVYAVIDTNVLVSALFARHPDVAPAQILELLFDRKIIPMYNDEILAKDPGPDFREDFDRYPILVKGPDLLDAATEQFDAVWTGKYCKECGRRNLCSDPVK